MIDYEKVFKLDKSKEHQQLLKEAKLELKKSKRKDYYKILGVAKTATDDEIKKAYRKRALMHHPGDFFFCWKQKNLLKIILKNIKKRSFPKWNWRSEKRRGKKFKEVGEAYAVLSDSKKRARYDNGQDLEEMGSGGMSGGGREFSFIYFYLFKIWNGKLKIILWFKDIDPNVLFQAFFGGGSPFMGGGGASGGRSRGGQNGFPGFQFNFG